MYIYLYLEIAGNIFQNVYYYVDKIHSINTGTCDVNLVQSLSDLINVRDRNVEDLSGGELQRFACAMVCIQKADM